MQGFNWIDGSDKHNAVLSFVRRDGAEHLVVVLHFGEGSCPEYRVGVPSHSPYRIVLQTDAARFGGATADVETVNVATEFVPHLGWDQSLLVALPPRAALVLAPIASPGGRDSQPPPEGTVPVPWGEGPVAVFGKG